MDGTFTFRVKGTKPERKYRMALPAYSVDTEEEAKHLQVLFCRYSYDRRYMWANFGETLEDLQLHGLAEEERKQLV